MTIQTGVFKGTPGAYVRRCMGMWLAHWWWALALPVAVCVALAFSEPVWLFVAMMIFFLLLPAVLAFVWYKYALSPEAVQTIKDKTVTLRDNGSIMVTMTETDKSHTYTPDKVKSVEDTGKTLVIRFKAPAYHHLDIPLESVPQDVRNEFAQRLLALNGPKTEMA